ncbi:MAG TPA: metallophosphoesterase, partial [Vicinamibacteria bacterium]|nr:metallophosphoesterase [Vicinamibacteria bacterium]
YAASLVLPSLTASGALSRRTVGAVSGRLMSQALFGDAIFLAAWLGLRHRHAGRRRRAAALGGLALALLAVYVDAYHVEPRMLRVRFHALDRAGERPGRSLRILHLTDIQAATIGPHEERALRAGLEASPDLIVMTGDYVEAALGADTEAGEAAALRALMRRLGFGAPLGVFATDGDAGPSCREALADLPVRCLADESVVVPLRDGDTLSITGLSRTRGRERDPAWLARLLERGPTCRHQLVISHAPDFVDALPVKVDLVLAGHTHGGQVVIPFFGPPVTASRLPRRYAAGLHDFGGIPLHVSRGIGMERAFSPPVRFLCPPEICILDVRLPAP